MTDELRGTGRTTACMLEAIALALRNPDEWVRFTDHLPASRVRDQLHAGALKSMVNNLHLEVDVKTAGADGVHLRSAISRLRAGWRG